MTSDRRSREPACGCGFGFSEEAIVGAARRADFGHLKVYVLVTRRESAGVLKVCDSKPLYLEGSDVRYHGTHRVSDANAMSNLNQQDFLKTAKDRLAMTWDELAAASGINPRALKTYRMPDTSKDFRPLPDLARAAVARLLETVPKKQRNI